MNRLRWDNIARAAAVLGVVALVVAWPHLKGAPPRLPPAAATPISVEDPALPAAPEHAAPEAPAVKPRPAHRRSPHRRRPKPRRHRIVPRAAVAPAPARRAPPPPRPVLASAPARSPSVDDQAAHEFAVP